MALACAAVISVAAAQQSATINIPFERFTLANGAALLLLISGQISLALNIAVFALVVLYFIHSLALLLLPALNPELFRSVTVRIPLWVQRVMALLSMMAMAALIGLQVRNDVHALRQYTFAERIEQSSLTTIELVIAWAAIGAVLYALRSGVRGVSHGGTAGGIEHAE